MYSDKLQLSLINNISLRNVIDVSQFAQGQAGFVKNGNYAWIVRESSLEILSTETGVKIAHYNFSKSHGSRSCVITCVEEVDYLPGVCILAVATEFPSGGPSAGVVSIFCVQGSKILGSMDFCERITCCQYISKSACARSVLQLFKGTIAIGTDQGKLFLIDLRIPSNINEIASSPSYEADLFPCINILGNVDQDQIAATHRQITSIDQQLPEKSFFSIQLDVLNDSGAIRSILSMPNLYTMAVGLNDGRLVLYDLADLQAFHLAYPPNNRSPLTHMSYLEPTDDPRCAVYIWAFHTTSEGAIAVMHSLMFATRVNKVYEEFKSCCVRLTMPMYQKATFPICCRSIMRTLAQDEEDILTLNVFAWTSPATRKTNIMIFDLNQWYKEEMPSVGDWRLKLKYVAVFELQNCISLDVMINENSVFPFNSILRPEEHFYPNSLNFDLCIMEHDKFSHYRWFGLQNIVLQQFNVVGPQIILEPSFYFNELLQVAIVPQFSDVTYGISTPIDLKREFLLSVALEYNFNGFLRKCACAWADGSYLGKDNSVGIGLSTLTDWIWNRARSIKDVCNRLCQPLFDYSEQRIDYGTQKQLSQCCKQLKVLSDLLTIILKDYRQHIPDHIFTIMKTQSETIKMASDYQEVLQWLLNVGLLPEGHYDSNERDNSFDDEFLIVPYPHQAIGSYYNSQRMKLADEWMGDDGRQHHEKTSNYLFIDAFIERECNSKKLKEIWNGVYPPKSIQALLRTLLVPDITIQSKHVIFVYLFMDITNILNEGAYASIVRNLIKFPAVFKMNPAMIKRTQAFWNLDNGHLDTAVEELISPLSHDKHLPLWQRELLIGALLKQNANSLALRALRCPGNQISSDLEMLTLLSNNLISEALKVQRASGNRKLLEKLFEKILHSPSYEQLLDLTLTEEEGVVLGEYLQKLKNTGLPNHLNIHFVFLLQRSKFLDAAQLVESLGNDTNMNLEPTKQVLNAYYSTMESTTRRLTSMAYTEEILAKESPLPLSVNLIQSRCNATNDIYQQCIQSITEAAYDNTQEIQKMPFIGSPKLGIFEYRQPTMSFQDNSFEIEVNEHGKRKQVPKKDQEIRLEDLEAPLQKKRRLDDSILRKKKSYMDVQTTNLTMFKETRPTFNFIKKSANSSVRTTPERVHTFGNFLNTPIVTKKTPIKIQECPPTPHSILKTRSCRGSVSPAPSRFSEFGDDNKSVKSITFAALPDSRDTSLNESSFLEESFNEEQMDSSAEAFYSPGKSPETKVGSSNSQSIAEGPKVRKSIKSRSTTPTDPTQAQRPVQVQASTSEVIVQDSVAMEVENEANMSKQVTLEESNLDQTVGSDASNEYGKPFRRSSVLKHLSSGDSRDSESDSEEISDDSAPDKSIFNYVRRSVLPPNFGDITYSSDEENTEKKQPVVDEPSDDSEDIEDEHYEEEELPQHSDYDDSCDPDGPEDEYEYGEVNLNDSSDSESQDHHQNIKGKTAARDEVICLDSSSDEDVVEQMTVALPSFGALGNVEVNVPSSSDFVELVNVQPSNDVQIVTQEEMFSTIYDDLEHEKMETEEVHELDTDIESPPYEEVVSTAQAPSTLVSFGEQIVESTKSTVIIHPVKLDFETPAEGLVQDKTFSQSYPTVSEPQSTTGQSGNAENSENVEKVDDHVVSSSQEKEKVVEITQAAPETSTNTMMSEDYSFVSATGDELNQGILVMDQLTPVADSTEDEVKTEPSCIKKDCEESEVHIEATKPLDQAQNVDEISIEITNDDLDEGRLFIDVPDTTDELNIAQSVKEKLDETISADSKSATTPPINTRTLRSRATSIEPSERNLRGSSVPSSGPSSPRSRSTRASTEDRQNPKNLLKVKTMERIEESVTPVSSPGVLTRRRSQLLESGEANLTPQTPTRLTRRNSHLSDDGKSSTHSTPSRRPTRASSKDSLLQSETEKSPEEPGQLKRTLSSRSTLKRTASASADENDDAKSTRSTRSTRSSQKKLESQSSHSKVTPEKAGSVEPTEELSVMNRRLTRQQLQVVEKSRQLSAKIASAANLRATKSENVIKTTADDDSDNESIKSESGSIASSRASRKRKVTKKTKEEDSKSVASKTSRRSESPKWNQLSVIPEESNEDPSEVGSSTTSRSRKAKK